MKQGTAARRRAVSGAREPLPPTEPGIHSNFRSGVSMSDGSLTFTRQPSTGTASTRAPSRTNRSMASLSSHSPRLEGSTWRNSPNISGGRTLHPALTSVDGRSPGFYTIPVTRRPTVSRTPVVRATAFDTSSASTTASTSEFR